MVRAGIIGASSLFSIYAFWCAFYTAELTSIGSEHNLPNEYSHGTPPPLKNDDFLQPQFLKPESFNIDDTDLLLINRSALKAVPYDFGYTVEEGLEVFPPYEYPRCSDSSASLPGEFIDLDFENNLIRMRCRGPIRGKFVLGPTEGYKFMNPREVNSHFNLSRMTFRPEHIEDHHEWAIGSCRESGFKYELHTMKPRFQPEAHVTALNKTKELEEAFNVTKPPLAIAMVTVDSFSRRHFYRKLTRTIEFLNQLEKEGDWKVTDFKLHNIIGTDTAENQSHIFGTTFKGYASRKELRGADLFGKSAIWRYLKDKGFVSLLGFDACPYKMNRVIGRMPTADHVVNPFYCAAEKFSGVSSHKKAASYQRCLGKNMAHWYLMDYTLKFMDIYHDNNLWAYNHFTTAHEITGQHAQTLDEDLVWYLKELIDRSKDRDLVIYVIGDHGMRYGNFISNTEAIQEHRLPVFFMLNKRTFLNSIEYSYDSLHHNAARLTSKPDVRRSLKFLAENRYGESIKKSSSGAINLFTEKAADDRTCEDIGIPAWYCSTYVLELVPYNIYNSSVPYSALDFEQADARDTILASAAEALFIINSESYGSPNSDSLCQKLTLDEISIALYHYVPDRGLVMKLALTVHQSETAKFDVWFLLTPECILETPAMETHNFPPFLVYYRSQKLCGKLINAFRTDSYKGECEALAREAEINAEFCICHLEDNQISNGCALM